MVVAGKGFPENPMVGQILPGAGKCNTQRCDGMSPPCTGNDFPGSGNPIVLLHDNGEFSTLAHMTTGPNDLVDCSDMVLQGVQIGTVGNVGTTTAPHLHYSPLNTPSPEDPGARSFPMYFNNIKFASPGFSPRRQLDVAMFSGTEWVVLDPPLPLPANSPSGPGLVNEIEPNDTLGSHQANALGTTVQASLAVGDLAVRGDGIEVVYRIDLGSPESLRIDLSSPSGPEPGLLRPHRGPSRPQRDPSGNVPGSDGTSLPRARSRPLSTNADPTRTENAPYDLGVASDPHDQLFKEFLHEFLRDFLKLFYPEVEARLDFGTLRFPYRRLRPKRCRPGFRSRMSLARIRFSPGAVELEVDGLDFPPRFRQR